MKVFCLCFGMMIVMLGIWVEIGIAQSTWMPDANLREEVLAQLKALNIVDSTATTFTQANLGHADFTSLAAAGEGIVDLTGLEHATNLTKLVLSNNKITKGISKVSALTSLTDLSLSKTGISDISVVSSLTSLTTLRLIGNGIGDISALKDLTNLTYLHLGENNISDISYLSKLTRLTNLGLTGNRISNISAVSNLTELASLNLSNNSISDISVLSKLTKLKHLYLGNNKISDISVLSKLIDLHSLYLGNDEIRDFSVLSKLTTLTSLFLVGSQITTTDVLLPLTKLVNLNIQGHRITDVGEFQKLLQLLPPKGKLKDFRFDFAGENQLSILNDIEALRQFLWTGEPDLIDAGRAVSFEAPPEKPPSEYQCPVGWQRTDAFARKTRRVIIYEVNLDMDLQNRVSIYKPTTVAIYVHPDEALETLDGWKLQVAIPYNHHRNYLLTAENSVVVDSEIEGVEGGFAFIKNPEADPFPMVGMGFTGATVPGFDYRLYDDRGQRVDFGIACYKRGDIFQVLRNMEEPRVFRKVDLETLDWDVPYIRSEWTVPIPVPAAPSLIKKTIVGTWGDLKKNSNKDIL